MLLKGHCDVQDCEYEIDIDKIPIPSFDSKNSFLYGRIECPYASYGGNCDGECSILKQHGIKQG